LFCFFVRFFIWLLLLVSFRFFLAVASMFRYCLDSGILVYQKKSTKFYPFSLVDTFVKSDFLFSESTAHCVIFHVLLVVLKITKTLLIMYHLIICMWKNWLKFRTCLSAPKIMFSSCWFSGQILTFVAKVASFRFHLILNGSYLSFISWPFKQPFCNLKTKFDLV
jgi:hypothetical protein